MSLRYHLVVQVLVLLSEITIINAYFSMKRNISLVRRILMYLIKLAVKQELI